MDWTTPLNKGLEPDLENGVNVGEEEDYSSPLSGVKRKALQFIAKVKGSFPEGSDDRVSLSGDASNSGRVHVENVQAAVPIMKKEGQESKDDKENKLVKEKRKSLSNKKAPKPPRPPRAPSLPLDAADQKLIREIAELARLKRARIERMKALKKMKAAKATSSNNSNLFATVFTIIFCLVFLLQGMSSKGSGTSFQGSPVPAGAVEGSLISLQFSGNPSASIPNRPHAGSPTLVEQVAGSDGQEKQRRFSR